MRLSELIIRILQLANMYANSPSPMVYKDRLSA